MDKIITLSKSSPSIQYLCKEDRNIAKLIDMVGIINYKLYEDPYVFLVNTIIEQMLSKKAGKKISSRLENLCGGKITPDSINSLSIEDIKSIGTSYAKADYIKTLTTELLSGTINFELFSIMSDNDVIKELKKYKGIGDWTAHMYLIFVLDRQDVLPITDVAFLQVYKWLYNTNSPSKSTIIDMGKKWSPYSSIVARYFYRALDLGLTKKEIQLI